jgi:hypothetical protein
VAQSSVGSPVFLQRVHADVALIRNIRVENLGEEVACKRIKNRARLSVGSCMKGETPLKNARGHGDTNCILTLGGTSGVIVAHNQLHSEHSSLIGRLSRPCNVGDDLLKSLSGDKGHAIRWSGGKRLNLARQTSNDRGGKIFSLQKKEKSGDSIFAEAVLAKNGEWSGGKSSSLVEHHAFGPLQACAAVLVRQDTAISAHALL